MTNKEYADLAVYCNENNKHIEKINGQYVAVDNPEPTDEEIKQARANAYLQEVDPITVHIQRLRDEEGSEEKIKELIEQRKQKVEEIKARYPYPEE